VRFLYPRKPVRLYNLPMPEHNLSPWLHQLDHSRLVTKVEQDVDADIAIVGAGIAGVSTAFFTLRDTDRSVVIVDRFRLAHGATGHNAGLVIAGFERPLQELETEFGLEATGKAIKAFDDAWLLLEEIYQEASLTIPFSRFTEQTGLISEHQLQSCLLGSDVRRRTGHPVMPINVARGLVSEEALKDFDPSLYAWVEQADVLRDLETEDKSYIAVQPEPGGTINSALFCQEVMAYLQKMYPDRLRLYEETKIAKAVFGADGGALLDAGEATIRANKVVLCTNGFEDFTLIASNGLEIDKKFHKNVRGVVSYMSGYLMPMSAPPAGLVYLQHDGFSINDPYYYLSRRPYEYEKGSGPRHNLLSVGGPQSILEDHTAYSFQDGYPDAHINEIEKFLATTFDGKAPTSADRFFSWHGLMGYTNGMIRVVGVDPQENDLMYNLGCNGIGLLPSIFGGKRIATILSGNLVEPLIFDPR
jgi:glycine/D-amino acid oxidase-like deaminating enzyme